MPLDDNIIQRLYDNDITLSSLDVKFIEIGNQECKALAEILAKNTILTS